MIALIPTSLAQYFWKSLWAVAPVQKMRMTFDALTNSPILFGTASSMLVSLAPTMVQLSSTSHMAMWCFVSIAFFWAIVSGTSS